MDGESDLAQAMHSMLAMAEPVREAMIGYRKQLETDGWSPESAEMIAANFFIGLQSKMFST